ncbi:hypothetical protein MUK42_22266 [Musa troglodytarum]|uniref:Uncharacterized protein n=1 Tax=Musa troglodytarum TaxID=320322 RepID=A0A9E7L9Z4_9LILI|nr:hypothetical protein MUK42_22266 [Musa troglodytarum]
MAFRRPNSSPDEEKSVHLCLPPLFGLMQPSIDFFWYYFIFNWLMNEPPRSTVSSPPTPLYTGGGRLGNEASHRPFLCFAMLSLFVDSRSFNVLPAPSRVAAWVSSIGRLRCVD